MRLDKIHWVDLNEPKKQEVHFTPLNENTETPTFKYKTGATAKDSLKPQILATTLFDAVMKYRTNLVKESRRVEPDMEEGEEESTKSIFQVQQWTDFIDTAKMIAGFMGASQEDIDRTIQNITDTFSALGGQGGPEMGYQNIQSIESILKDKEKCNLASTKPPVVAQDFLNAMMKANGENQKADIAAFVKLIKTRNKRKLAPYLSQDGITLGSILASYFKDKKMLQKIYDVFYRMFQMVSFKKNGADIGKGEVAMVMFFGDCRFPDDNGDIQLIGEAKGAIELKTNTAIITDRIKCPELANKKWSELKQINGTKNFPSNSRIWKMLKLGQIKNIVLKGKYTEEVLRLNREIDKAFPKLTDEQKTTIWFKAMFGALFAAYATDFDKMVLINTDPSGSNPPLNKSKTFVTPIVQINYGSISPVNEAVKPPLKKPVKPVKPVKSLKTKTLPGEEPPVDEPMDDSEENMTGDTGGSSNWLSKGEGVLNYLLAHNVDVFFGTRDNTGQGGFKARFMSTK